jgi:hypothetical protein
MKGKTLTREATVTEQEKIDKANEILKEVDLQIVKSTKLKDGRGGAVIPRKGF